MRVPSGERPLSLETHFDPTFTSALALREKQIQQSYRPLIGVHKWFARRPGSVFRSLLLAEFVPDIPVDVSYWKAHQLRGVVADPFMGGGTPLVEANRLGFDVVGADINPMAHWVVRQSLARLNLAVFLSIARDVVADVEREIGDFYRTECTRCGRDAPVKYFLWVKTERCPECGTDNDLFPGYLLAEAVRHPKHVVACAACGALNEYEQRPRRDAPAPCGRCSAPVHVEGPARGNRIRCRACDHEYRYPAKDRGAPPDHRMWALEYHCSWCKPTHQGRFFKEPDAEDHDRVILAARCLQAESPLPIPTDVVPTGDETTRLHRWGYLRYREMFNARQLLGLGLLLRRIRSVPDDEVRHALLTVFSDVLRYQNLLCRYDTYALKCQDIFSVHGFPVGLVQCENNLLGIPRVGSGAFRHFVEKYVRAKQYCVAPYETRVEDGRKRVVPVVGESIGARLVTGFPGPTRERQAWLRAASAATLPLPATSLDGVFTDPPYFDNVQYAELMDFCYVWLRLGLGQEFAEFQGESTRHAEELTGNVTLGRDLEHFTGGLSAVFRHYAGALKPGAPFVFTYHHNDPTAYLPLVVAILDAGLECTATLPAAAEMGASLHIAGTGSSILDTVFVCRPWPRAAAPPVDQHTQGAESSVPVEDLGALLVSEAAAMRDAGVRVTQGDVRCLSAGHLARVAVGLLRASWDRHGPLPERMTRAGATLTTLTRELKVAELVSQTLASLRDDG